LREIRPTDAQEIFKMRANGRVNEFIARQEMTTMEEAEKLAVKTADAFKNKLGIGWAGILRSNERIIGTCGFNHIDFTNDWAEIGGEMSTEYWGKNIAIEAVSAILQFGFETMRLHRIEARVSPENRSAIYLMESLGFSREGLLKDKILFDGRYMDLALYAVRKQEVKYLS
jgi:ribosomal-protein-alanine N-acetyltransferase